MQSLAQTTMLADAAQKLKIVIEPQSLVRVTAFADRAEILREIPIVLAEGLNEIVIENLAGQMHEDSVRVTGRGSAVVEEVQITERRLLAGEGDSERVNTLRAQRDALEDVLREKEILKRSGEKRAEALDSMLAQIGQGIASPHEGKFHADDETFSSINTFFDYYSEQALVLRKSIRDAEKKRVEAEEKLRAVEYELNVAQRAACAKVLSVFLNAKSAGMFVLELTYQISYFASVAQSTGEDWNNVQLVLSTAKPILGGEAPQLGTLDVSFWQAPAQQSTRALGGAPVMKSDTREAAAIQMLVNAVDAAPLLARMADPSRRELSTDFDVPRPATIPSDGANHKVTIGVLTLVPRLVHETVPCKAAAAFLTASAVNDSALPLLAGPASVYLDGAFVNKTDMRPVCPGERFHVSLGVDPAVHIEYRPAHNFFEQTGMLSKSSNAVHEQPLSVRNTRTDPILLVIREQLPRSTDEKIKVRLACPEDIEKVPVDAGEAEEVPRPGARLLPSHNLEWTVNVEKASYKNLLVKYAIEHPQAEKLEFHERPAILSQ